MTSAEIVGEVLGFVIFALIVYFVMPFFDKTQISKKERIKKAVLLSCFFTVIDFFFKFTK